jgi:DNA-binding transcriptional regulator YhcF (GntR family)
MLGFPIAGDTLHPHKPMLKLRFNPKNKTPIYKQIAHSIQMGIEKGELTTDYQLPSINELSDQYTVSRDTIEKSYKELKKLGYIDSVQSKGFFVVGRNEKKIKILLIFNKLSSYKKIIYYSFLETLQDRAKVDLQIHHYNTLLLKEIIESNLGKYHYYVIMPHFFHNTEEEAYLNLLRQIPANELLILDKSLPKLGEKYSGVFQNFRQDIYQVLDSARDLLAKYQRLVIVFPSHSNHPLEIIEGASEFCVQNCKTLMVIPNVDEETLSPGTVYLIITEADLALLIKKVRNSDYQLGREIGIICFNETILKELLDITVITTDFELMGRTAAQMILNKQFCQIQNPFFMIQRGSL